MNLFHQALDSFSSLISDVSVSFNPDIFESNIINLTILVSGLVYLINDALSQALSKRQEIIITAIQESEERLQQSILRFTESEKKLAQAQLVIDSIKKDTEALAIQVKASILTGGALEIKRLTATVDSQLITLEAKVRKQIYDHVVTLALESVTLQLEGKITTRVHQRLINNNISNISKLGS
jgi:F-type H+-transporting ATPase subunit b